MKKKTWWIVGLILILILLTGLLLHRKPEKKRDKSKVQRQVEAVVVRPTTLLEDITVSGSLLPNDEVELKNEVSGRIVYLHLPEGKAVSKGTLLVKLFDDDLQAVLRKLKAQLAMQEQILNRQTELVRINGISQNEYEQTRIQVNNLKAEIDAQRAQIRKTEVLAPFNGIIGLRNVSMGAVVSSSVTLATFRSSSLKLDFFVPEKYGDRIRPGMGVEFSLFSEENTHRASVIATERGIEGTTRNLKVRALINGEGSNLIPGAFAHVQLKLGENPNAILIPTEAILPMEREKQVIVARKGKAHFVPITTGIRKEAMVEVTDGLTAGDTLITSGLLFLKEGSDLNYSHVNDRP